MQRLLIPGLMALVACGAETTSPEARDSALPLATGPSPAAADTSPVRGASLPTTGEGAIASAELETGMEVSGCQEGLYVVGHLHRFDEWGSGGMEDPEERIRRIGAIGFAGTRLAFEWSQVEPLQGQRGWERHDRLAGLLQQDGLKAFGVLLFSPTWARPAGEDHTHRPIVQGSPARGDTSFASFAAAAARRYQGVIDRWEIWNEPNILQHHFWRHVRNDVEYGPDPADYLALYKLARDSILAANPSARVAVGGLANGPAWGPVQSPDPLVRWRWGFPAWAFLKGLLDAGLQPSDIALHPYPYQPMAAVHAALDSVKAVLDDHGYSGARVWITEWGIDHKLPGSSPRLANRQTRRGLYYLCGDPRIDLVTVFALTEKGRRDYSLVRFDGAVTNAGLAVTDWLSGGSRKSFVP